MRRMTNEEAIEVLDAMKVKVEIPKAAVTQYKRNVSLDMAIEALSKTKQGLSEDDVISRQAAIDILDAYQVMVENGEENPYAWARLRMSELPPAQPEPTLEQIEEYCHKRCLSIVDNALLNKYAQAEIIRCKDCKHLQKWRSEEFAMEFGQIYECGKGVLRDPLPDGSCSKAERRTDE